jgi:predicted transcriptional regulator
VARPLQGRVGLTDSLSQVQKIFEENNVAVVVDNGEVKGIINKIDLLEFINKKSRSGD